MVSRFYHSSFHRTCCVTLKITSTNNFETNGAPQSSPLSFTTALKIGTWILCSVPRVCSKTKTFSPGIYMTHTWNCCCRSSLSPAVGGSLRAFFLDRTSIRGTQREYSSKPLKHIVVKSILVFLNIFSIFKSV